MTWSGVNQASVSRSWSQTARARVGSRTAVVTSYPADAQPEPSRSMMPRGQTLKGCRSPCCRAAGKSRSETHAREKASSISPASAGTFAHAAPTPRKPASSVAVRRPGVPQLCLRLPHHDRQEASRTPPPAPRSRRRDPPRRHRGWAHPSTAPPGTARRRARRRRGCRRPGTRARASVDGSRARPGARRRAVGTSPGRGRPPPRIAGRRRARSLAPPSSSRLVTKPPQEPSCPRGRPECRCALPRCREVVA